MKEKCKCGRESVFFRKYEGTYLCNFHFFETIEKKIKKTMSKEGMINRKDRLAIALSGGKDSSVLLYVMNKVFRRRRDIEIFGISIDQGINNYSKMKIKKAKDFCKKLGIKHYVFPFGGVKKRGNKRFCGICSTKRNEMLIEKAKELKATKLCLGNNLDDEIQNILINYMEGDLESMLKKIKPRIRSLRIIKPLKWIPEGEIELYANLKGFDYPKEFCPLKDKIRRRVRDFLNSLEDKSSGIKFSILKTFESLFPYMEDVVKEKRKRSIRVI
jgi:uncharacterized protein (TIGR00269 family)